MTKEQEQALAKFLSIYTQDPGFLAALLVGSIAHGYSKPSSDLDIILLASDPEFERRKSLGKLAFSLWDICEYPGGYVDSKVVSLESLKQAGERGSDPARYAFEDAQVLFNKSEQLETLLAKIARYPIEQQPSRRQRFLSQVLAWKWYLSQGEEKSNQYLITLAVQKIVLFACRVILNENERLYPYHKWLLAETESCPRKPHDLMANIASLLERPQFSTAQQISDSLFSSLGLVEKELDWPNQFMVDSEQNWLHHEAPIDDL